METYFQRFAEFLVTYGWAIVIIVITIGLISYFNVYTPEDVEVESCSFGYALQCVEKPVVNFVTGDVSVLVKNKVGYGIHTFSWNKGEGDCVIQSGFSVTDPDDASVSYVADTVLEAEDIALLQFTCGDGNGVLGNFNADLGLTYYNVEEEKVKLVSGSFVVVRE